jgi:hypothetical protein
MVSAAGARDLAALVGAETLAGRWGDAVRQAQEDRDAIARARGQRDPRTTLDVPDLLPTAEELLERVISLAPTLHGLDGALAPAALQLLEERRDALARKMEKALLALARLRYEAKRLRGL